MSGIEVWFPWFRADDDFCEGLELDCEICGEPAAWIQWEAVRNTAASPIIGICEQHAAKDSLSIARDLYNLFDDSHPRTRSLAMVLAQLFAGEIIWPPRKIEQGTAINLPQSSR